MNKLFAICLILLLALHFNSSRAMALVLHSTAEPDTIPGGKDTTEVNIGRITIVIENDEGMQVTIEEESDREEEMEDEDDMDIDLEIFVDDDTITNQKREKKPKNVTNRWFLLDLGFNTYLNDFSTDLPAGYSSLELNQGKSINVNLNVFQQRINLIRHKFN